MKPVCVQEHEESAKPKEREENDESEENRPVLTAEQKAEQEKAQAEVRNEYTRA
jgi:hypothetical protein